MVTNLFHAPARDPDYLRSLGMARVVNQQDHRKELVAGGMVDYLVSSQSGSRAMSAFSHLSQAIVGPQNGWATRPWISTRSVLASRALIIFYAMPQAFSTHKLTDRLDLTGFLSDPLRELPQVRSRTHCLNFPSTFPRLCSP